MLRFRPCTPQWSQQGLHTYLHTMVTDSSVKIYNFVHVFLVQLFTNGRNVVQQSPILCPQKISSLIANRFARMAKKGNLQKDNRISLRTRNCSYTFSNTYCQLGLCPWSAWKYKLLKESHIYVSHIPTGIIILASWEQNWVIWPELKLLNLEKGEWRMQARKHCPKCEVWMQQCNGLDLFWWHWSIPYDQRKNERNHCCILSALPYFLVTTRSLTSHRFKTDSG